MSLFRRFGIRPIQYDHKGLVQLDCYALVCYFSLSSVVMQGTFGI